VNFTREPIIETVITPKDGYKLSIRNSKGGSQEEYFVDAIEVVSFGQSMFFRSQERPKSFLLPVTDYEVVEAKETRVVLKNAPLEGSIKIGGGRVHKAPKEQEEKVHSPAKPHAQQEEGHGDRPRRRKSSRRRRIEGEEGHRGAPRPQQAPATQETPVSGEKAATPSEAEPQGASSMFRSLFPPPPGLISDKFQQERQQQALREAAANNASESPQEKEEARAPTLEEEPSSVSDVVEEEKEDSSDEENSPRYHSAPKEDTEGPFFHAETNFVY